MDKGCCLCLFPSFFGLYSKAKANLSHTDTHLPTTVSSNDVKEKKLANHCVLPLTESLR